MPVDEPAEADLLELAYMYAMDAVTELERAVIERRRALADPATAAKFDAIVARVDATIVLVGRFDSCPPPPELESRVLESIEQIAVQEDSDAEHLAGGSATFGLGFAVAVLLSAFGVGAVLTEFHTVESAMSALHAVVRSR